MPFAIDTTPTTTTAHEDGPRSGKVDKIKFVNSENGFCVLFVSVNGKRETWVGTMPHAFEGATLKAEGKWEPSKYGGDQFRVTNSSTPPPKEKQAAISHIAGLVDGIGPKTAEKIYEKFGEEVWAVMEKTPERMREVVGLGEKKADALCKAWSGQKDLGRVIVWLQGHGLGTGLANRIVKTYGNRAMEVVQKQPYRLAMDIAGIGFRKADEIARGIGIQLTDPERVQAGLLYVLEESFVGNGHCFAWDKDLIEKATETLAVGSDLVAEGLGRLEKRGRVKTEVEGTASRVFPKRLAETEEKVAWYLARLMKTEGKLRGTWYQQSSGASSMSLEKAVEAAIVETEAGGMKLSEAQAQAMRLLATEKVMVITGPPGTGKTALMKCILSALKKAGATFDQAAPTGKAAKRIRDSTGESASTIHSLLAYDPKTGAFTHNETNTLPIDALCCDEQSMTDVSLMRHMLAAVHPESRLIIVGDVDQLPSVGPGAVLRDIIESGSVPTVRLSHIFRQAARSTIITNSHAINAGKMPVSDNATAGTPEFLIMPAEGLDDPGNLIVDVVTRLIPEQFGFGAADIQVLCPKKDGKAGVNPINTEIQKIVNPNGKAYRRGESEFRVGDRVMHLKNDYGRKVFNGDVGYVAEVFDAGAKTKTTDPVLRVQYDEGWLVDYSGKQMHELTLAYASTVHKCVAPGTLVDTSDGLLPISMISPTGNVSTSTGVKPYFNFVRNIPQPTLRFLTRDGYRIETTLDHGMVVVRNGVPVQIEASEVQTGDMFRLPLGVHCDRAGGRPLPKPTSGDVRERVYRTPECMSVELAELLGLMLADAITNRYIIRLIKQHNEVSERFRDLLHAVFGAEANACSGDGADGYEMCSTFLCRWFKQLGGLQAKRKSIPECVMRGSLEEQTAFLRGLFEDGSAHVKNGRLDHVELGTEYADVAAFVRVVLLQLGIISGTTTSQFDHINKVEIYGEHAHRFGKIVGFISKFKQDRVRVSGGRDGYKVPLTVEEMEALCCHGASKQERVTLRNKKHVRRWRLAEWLSTMPESSVKAALQDKLQFHYSPVTKIEASESETMCIEVPDGHRFVQAGMDHSNCQGSQYPAIVMPVLTSQFIMLSRNLVYTGVTRAQKLVVLVAEQKAMKIALAETRKEQRNTRLAYRIQQAMEAAL